jgi:Type II secretory pathway, component PulC
MASSVSSRSIAIIAREGQQQSYGVGDVIQGTDARITNILPDRVIITRQQQQESLLLDENAATAPTATPVLNNPGLPNARQQILKNPAKLMDYLTIAPVRGKQSIKGISSQPRKEP